MQSIKLLIILAFCLISASVFAADVGKLETDGKGNNVQGGAPRGTLTQNLTGISYTTDGTGVWWAAYCAADAKARLMPTSAKGAYKQFTIPAGVYTGFVVNKATPFVNISGCTGDFIRQ